MPVILLTAMLPAFAAAPAQRPAETAEETPAFRIASYNINYGNPNLKAVVAAIHQADADIVALQETNRVSERYLRRHLKKRYPHISFRHASRAGGFAFLSKVPLQRLRFLPRSEGWFGTYVATVTLGGRTMQLVNVHLQPTVPQRGESALAFLQRWSRDQKTRRREIEHIVKQLNAETPAIILGDFNALPHSSVAKFIEACDMTDSYTAVTPSRDQEHTWHWRIGGVNWTFRLDYLYHGPQLTTKHSDIVRSDGSDHDLIVSTLRWTPPEETAANEAPEGKTHDTPDSENPPNPAAATPDAAAIPSKES